VRIINRSQKKKNMKNGQTSDGQEELFCLVGVIFNRKIIIQEEDVTQHTAKVETFQQQSATSTSFVFFTQPW
jgi:hypothetical protein